MASKITVNDQSVKKVMGALRSLLLASTTKQTMLNVGDAAIKIIKDRTSNLHKDSDRKTFKRYSKSYAKRKGVARNAVDLVLSKQMMNAMSKKVEKNTAILFFNDSFAEKKAVWNHGGTEDKGGNQIIPPRPFFDIGKVKSEIVVFDLLINQAIKNKQAKVQTELK